MRPVPGCAVVVLSARLGPVLPAAALPLLREAAAVYTDGPDLPGSDCQGADYPGADYPGADFRGPDFRGPDFPGAAPVPSPEKLSAQAAVEPVVLITHDASGPAARLLTGGGAPVVSTPEPAGAALLDAVAVMDRLRSPGGCPWDAEQTHASLRQYLVEEAYELLDAIEHGDRDALREELGDVLLQVLFHARVAAEDAGQPFGVDDVAAALVDKLVSRHPHVFAGSERLATAADQELRWEELKREEKRRSSAVDGVALGQPAVALAAKLVSRATRMGLPPDLLPGAHAVPQGRPAGDPVTVLFAAAAAAKRAGHDPESELRAVALRFAAGVRAAEESARAAGLDPTALTEDQWRAHFPR